MAAQTSVNRISESSYQKLVPYFSLLNLLRSMWIVVCTFYLLLVLFMYRDLPPPHRGPRMSGAAVPAPPTLAAERPRAARERPLTAQRARLAPLTDTS